MIIQEMTRSECLSALAGARLGRLACARENQPYVVPIYFAYEEPYVYGFTTPGLKVEWMRSNPRVCVEIDEVDQQDHWTSVIVFGQYEELPSDPDGEKQRLPGPQRRIAPRAWTEFPDQERVRAHELLQRHAGWWEPGCASVTQREPEARVTPVFYRIRIDSVTGRRARPSPGVAHRLSARSLARDSQG